MGCCHGCVETRIKAPLVRIKAKLGRRIHAKNNLDAPVPTRKETEVKTEN